MTLQFTPGLVGVGQARPLSADDLDAATLKADTEVTVYSQEVNNDKLLYWGYGGKNRQAADTKFTYADLVASGAGTGTAGDAIEGELIAAITDSDQRRVLEDVSLGDLGELADAASDDRTERPVMFALAPYARPGRHIELRIRARSGSDGVEVDNDEANSSARFWYGEISG